MTVADIPLYKRSTILRASIDSVRNSLRFAGRRCNRWGKYLGRSRAINAYLKSHAVRKLHVGAGTNFLSGWLNTDLIVSSRSRAVYLDATKAFPLPDRAFDYVFSEHMIEHIGYKDGKSMLRECWRVLEPGGRIRIATPCLDNLMRLHQSHHDERSQHYIRWVTDYFLPEIKEYRPSIVINNAFYNWGHQFIYDRETLKSALENAGFKDVVEFSPGNSGDENLQGLERHGKVMGNEDVNQFETMVYEARR